MPLKSPKTRTRLIGSVAGLAAFIALSSKAQAQSPVAGEQAADGLMLVTDLAGVVSAELREDGSVVVTFEDGSVRVLAAGEVIVEGGAIFIDPAAIAEMSLDGGSSILPIILGVAAVGGAAVAIAGGGDDDDEAPVLNGAPVINSAATVTTDENQTATGLTVSAVDPEGDAVTFSIAGGDDAAQFAIDPNTGVLSFVEAPDFENPADADGDNVFEVVVEATDGNFPVSQLIQVTLNNVNDNAPVIVSGDEISVRENGTEVTTVEAQDADNDAITFSLSGTDAALFAIDAATGIITFVAAPDFENPEDANGDNVYNVTVTASDGLNEVTQDLAITVTDQNEVVGTPEDDVLVGTNDDDVIDALAGDDIIDSLEGSDLITTGEGADRLLFAGDPFEGADVSAEGRQIVGGEDFISDFDFAADSYQIDAEDFAVGNDVNFVALDANADGAEIPAGSNVIVLLNSDNDGDPDTPFLAGTAAAQIAELVDEPGPGIFVYWNSNLGVNRLVYSTDLSSADADLKILSRQTDLEGQGAIDALANFSAENFTFFSSVEIGTEEADTITATDGDDLIDALAGDDVIESLAGSDDITTGEGSDVLVFAGDPFEGADVSAEGRQIVGGEDFIRDFSFGTAVTSIIVNQGETSQAVVDAADAGNIYFNIHSSNFPAGEVRGNLTLVEDNRDEAGVGSVTFNAVLNGENEVQDPAVVTDAVGTGTVTFTIDAEGNVTYTTEIEIENFDISTLTVGHFHEAPEGENGPVVVDILADAREDGSIEGELTNADTYRFEAEDLGLNAPVNFLALDANAEGAEIPAGSNVIVLLNSDNDGDPDTPFLAGTAAAQIAELVDEAGPGLFVYWNSNLGVNRLVYSTDLSSADADLKILSRQTDLEGQDAIDALANFSAENFEILGDFIIGTDEGETLVGTENDDFINGLAGDDIIDSREGSDEIFTGEGSDVLVFAGDPFEGADVSAEGRQIVGGEDFIRDFSFGTAVTSIIVNQGETSQAVVDAADAGNIYFNIHSSNFPAGEVRGNLTLVEDNRDEAGVGSVTFNAVLNGENEVQDPAVVTDAVGTGTVTFTIDAEGNVTYTTEIEIENFDISTLTVGHFHEAPEGENGPVVVDILADAREDGSIEGSLEDGDLYQFDAGDLGINAPVSFVSLDANAEGATIPEGANVIVLLNSDNDGDPDTPFLAGTAAAQIAELVDEPGPGIFVYWNSNLGVNRLVYSSDLSSADADLKILSRQTDLEGQDAIDALADFTSENFEILGDFIIGTDEGETLVGTENDDFINGLAGDDIIDSREGSDEIFTGEGSDVLVFAGDPFEGADVSAEGRQIVGGEDFIRDFSFGTAVTSIIVNQGETSQAVVDAADAGNIYFNIHSSNFPAGEVRGNLTLVEDNRDEAGVGSVTFNAVLNGENEVQDPAVVTDAVGTGTVTFTIDAEGNVTYTTEIEIENFDISTLTVGHFHEAPEGENGPVVVDILADAREDGSIEGSLEDGDLYQFDAGDLGINAPVSFVSLDANAEGATIPEGANVIVLLNSDNDGDPDTPFLAGTAAAQIAELVDEPGPGIFVYWNSNLGVNRLVYSSDLSSADADLKILSRQTDLEGQDAIDALADFTSENFVLVGDGEAAMMLTDTDEVSLLSVDDEASPASIDFAEVAQAPEEAPAPAAVDVDALFIDPLDDAALAALAQAQADAAAGGL